MKPTELTFIGTASCTPDAGNDTACFLLNGHVLVDCGWCAALSLLRTGHSATDLSHLLITHCHHDHYMGLASVLFYRRMQKAKLPDERELVVGGPAEDIERVVELARAYLQVDRFSAVQTTPEVLRIDPGESLRLAEFEVRTAPTRHPVQSMAYRLHDTRSGASIGISGDTAYLPELAEFFADVDLLIMEGSRGLTDPPPESSGGHSSVLQSARIAAAAGVGRLALVHVGGGDDPAELLRAAREVFPRTEMPGPGDTVVMGERG